MYSFVNGAKGGLVSAERALMTETSFKMMSKVWQAGRGQPSEWADFGGGFWMARAGSDP